MGTVMMRREAGEMGNKGGNGKVRASKCGSTTSQPACMVAVEDARVMMCEGVGVLTPQRLEGEEVQQGEQEEQSTLGKILKRVRPVPSR